MRGLGLQLLCLGAKLTTNRVVRVNLGCQFDEIQDHHGNKSLGMFVSGYLVRLIEVGKSHCKCE